MPEVANAGKDHREALLIGGGDHLRVAERPARLDHGGRAGFRRGEEPVGEGKERVGCDDRAFGQRLGGASAALIAAMRAESTRLICPAPMPTVAPSFA